MFARVHEHRSRWKICDPKCDFCWFALQKREKWKVTQVIVHPPSPRSGTGECVCRKAHPIWHWKSSNWPPVRLALLPVDLSAPSILRSLACPPLTFHKSVKIAFKHHYMLFLGFSILSSTECDRTEELTVWLAHLGGIKWRVSVTTFACFTVKPHRIIGIYVSDAVISVGSFFSTKVLICASAWPVCRSWQYILKSPDSDSSVSCRCSNRFGDLSHFLVCGIPEKRDSCVWPTIDLLQSRLLSFVLC